MSSSAAAAAFFLRGGDDMLMGGLANDALGAENGDDYLDGVADDDVLRGGRGADTLQFAAGISADQLWFRKTGICDLEVGIIGTNDSMTISSWDFWSKGSSWENAQRIEQIRTADGKVLTDSQVNQLIQAMAAFAPPSVGQTILPPDYQKALAPVLAASWR